ncbi:hypothetical protein HHI36_000120 [Cryptolaemus montrouzieri]|uniref:Uncharacterized protein n=1 Tax=Cryptolaemus montrouzieri TaxID=559131 RepID=A0ABD2P4S5_9CUCU
MITRSNTQGTRRSTRQPVTPVKTPPETPRKSPRGRKIGRRASEASEDALDDKEKVKSGEEVVINTSPEVVKVETDKPSEPLPSNTSTENENVKQPVVPTKENVGEKPPVGLKAVVMRRLKGEMGQEPMTLIDPVTGLLTPMRECEENKYIPVPGEKKPGVLVTAPAASVVVTTAENKPLQQTVLTTSQHPATAVIKPQVKPQSLKAHVLSSQAAQAVVTQQVPIAQKQNAIITSSSEVE